MFTGVVRDAATGKTLLRLPWPMSRSQVGVLGITVAASLAVVFAMTSGMLGGTVTVVLLVLFGCVAAFGCSAAGRFERDGFDLIDWAAMRSDAAAERFRGDS